MPPAVASRFRWKAQPRQDDFLGATEDVVLYGGAAGGGKTDALLIHGLLTCSYHPGANVLFLRREYTQLNEPGAAISRSHELFPNYTGEWHQQDRRWTFKNGSTFQFGNLQYSHSIYSYQGAQIDCLLFDELTQFEEMQFDYLSARVRATVPNIRTSIRAATNPGGIGHGWVKRRFIDVAPWGEPFDWTNDDGKVTGRARFIPARLEDNPALTERDPTYIDKLSQLPPEMRRALRDGDWDLFLGQFFTEWRRTRHVCDPFPVPAGWPRWRAIDWGYGAPYCCLWLARSPERRIYVYRELYAQGILDVDQARAIARASQGELIASTVADPSMWNTQPNGTTIAGTYASKGVSVLKANNDRNVGWQRVHEALAGETPQLQIFATCLNLIRTLPLLIHDAIDVEDVDTKGEDHAADALRYGLCAGEPRKATKTPYTMSGAPIDRRHWAERTPSVMVRER